LKKIIHPPEVANLVSGIREFGYTIDTAMMTLKLISIRNNSLSDILLFTKVWQLQQ